jgi:hypothetical protein
MHKNKTAQPLSIAELLAAQTPLDVGAVPQRAMRSWQQLADQLTPYIGEAGLCALFGRATHLTQAGFDWLPLPSSSATSPQILFEALAQALGNVEGLVAAQANARLLEIFTNILSALIGEVLATRILNSAWTAESDAKSTQENHK